MAVNEQRGSGREAGMHGEGLAGVELDEDETLPGGAIAQGVGPELVQEGLFELVDFLHMHAGDEGLSGSGGIGEDDVFEFIGAGRKYGGAFVDFGGIEEVEDGKALHLENL